MGMGSQLHLPIAPCLCLTLRRPGLWSRRALKVDSGPGSPVGRKVLLQLLTPEAGKLGPMLTKTKSWVESQTLGPGWLCPGQLVRWAEAECGPALGTEHLVQIKGLLSMPGQEHCRVGSGTRPGRANTALIEALLDF